VTHNKQVVPNEFAQAKSVHDGSIGQGVKNMSRNKHINWLCTQGTTNVEIQALEELADESDMLHDAVLTITSLVITTEDDSYDFVEGSHFPLRIRFDEEGLSVLAPCIYAGEPGLPAVVRGDLKWEDMTDFELEELGHLALCLQKQYHPLAEVHLDEAVEIQTQLTSYRVRFGFRFLEKEAKVVKAGYEEQDAPPEEVAKVIWDNDAPELEQHIRDHFGEDLISFELLGPMESF